MGRVAAAILGAGLALAPAALAQQGTGGAGGSGQEVRIGGLLRTGLRVEGADSTGTSGFDIFDARLSARGRVGPFVDYLVQGEYSTDDERFRLLDARLEIPLRREAVLAVGQFKAPFSREELLPKDQIVLVRRAQAVEALAPGRQVGAQLRGSALQDRLTYAGGLFNGNGRTLRNDDNRFLYVARAQYNTIGPVEFYEGLILQVGADVAFSSDSAADLSAAAAPGSPASAALSSFAGDRFLWSLDATASYQGGFLRASYLRAELQPRAPGTLGLPVPADSTFAAAGGYVEGGYALWGAVEGVLRYDLFDPVGPDSAAPKSKFLVAGLNVYPGLYTRLTLQYAVGLDGTREGPGLADNQFVFMLQLAY